MPLQKWDFKLVGFVNGFFQINTNQVILVFLFSKTNPLNESFEHRGMNQIHKANLLNTVGQNESTIQIFWKQYEFANPKPRILTDLGLLKVVYVVKICEDSWKKAESLEVLVSNQIQESKFLRIGLANPDSWIYEVGFKNHDTTQTFLESWSVSTIQNESMDLQNKSMFLRISCTIPTTLTCIQADDTFF
jgi:hypothetical protein